MFYCCFFFKTNWFCNYLPKESEKSCWYRARIFCCSAVFISWSEKSIRRDSPWPQRQRARYFSTLPATTTSSSPGLNFTGCRSVQLGVLMALTGSTRTWFFLYSFFSFKIINRCATYIRILKPWRYIKLSFTQKHKHSLSLRLILLWM